jgi:signal transduction histidine kinase
MKSPPAFRPLLFLGFGSVALLFVVSTMLANRFSYELEPRNESISLNALPSILRLTAATGAIRDLEAASEDYPGPLGVSRESSRAALEARLRAVDTEIAAYLDLPVYPGERDLFEVSVRAGLRDVDAAILRKVAVADEGRATVAQLAADRDVRDAVARTAGFLRNMVNFNARHAEEDVDRIAAVHRSATRGAILLDGIALLCAAAVAFWVARRSRAHDRLFADHHALLETRARELEIFGQRIAHDLLSPLSALTFCLAAFRKASESDPKLKDALARAMACVLRAKGLVNGIFDFARSGGKPEAGASADLREVLHHVVDEARASESGASIELRVEPFENCRIACDPGVLASIASNLVRNAIKYMSDSALKQVTIRVRDQATAVQVAVEDTGPGIPSGLETLIFEPYFRAEGVTQPGLGLGLATVKRLCEAHGGSVGMRSTAGQGSLFWFTLPKV